MIVLYPVLVLSVIAGHGIAFAEDVATTTAAATLSAVTEAANTTAATTAKPEQPTSKTETSVKKAETATNDADDAPMADNSEDVNKKTLGSTLDRITKVLDETPDSGRTAAVPLVPGKHYDFFLLKVPKRENQGKTTEKPHIEDVGRNLSPQEGSSNPNQNNVVDPNSWSNYPAQSQPGYCPCSAPPPQVAPALNMLQQIYGNALTFGAVFDPSCPAGLVGSNPPLIATMQKQPAIDGIPVQDAYSYQYGEQIPNNYYTMHNTPSSTGLLGYYLGGANVLYNPTGRDLGDISYAQLGATHSPPTYMSGDFKALPPYIQNYNNIPLIQPYQQPQQDKFGQNILSQEYLPHTFDIKPEDITYPTLTEGNPFDVTQPQQYQPQPYQPLPQPYQPIPQPYQSQPRSYQPLPQPYQPQPQPYQPLPQPYQLLPQPYQPQPQPNQPQPQPQPYWPSSFSRSSNNLVKTRRSQKSLE